MDAPYATAYADLYRSHWWWRARERILLAKIRSVVAGSAPIRILDVGCGAGLFFDGLAQFGSVHGIETDASVATQNDRWSAHITVGPLDDSYRPEAPFELILMLDVLEHIEDPTPILRRAAEIARPGGRILITVPAFSWLWTAHDDLNQHVRRYSAVELHSLLGDASLIPLETSYLFQSLLFAKLLVRAKEQVASKTKELPRVPGTSVNKGLQAWCWAEHRALGWLPFGSSLMVVAARKPDETPRRAFRLS
jgi:SAM-dependent methyltransferase